MKTKNFYTLPKRLFIFFLVLLSVILFKSKLSTYVNGQREQESTNHFLFQKIVQTKWQEKLLQSRSQQELSLVTLNKSYQFRREEKTILFEKISLPKAIVEIRFLADISYFVDLRKKFDFIFKENRIVVYAPMLEFHRPNVDLNTLKLDVVKKGMLVDEEQTLDKLRQQLPLHLHDSAIRELASVRAKARQELKEFLQTWFFKEEKIQVDLEVIFADELEPITEPN